MVLDGNCQEAQIRNGQPVAPGRRDAAPDRRGGRQAVLARRLCGDFDERDCGGGRRRGSDGLCQHENQAGHPGDGDPGDRPGRGGRSADRDEHALARDGGPGRSARDARYVRPNPSRDLRARGATVCRPRDGRRPRRTDRAAPRREGAVPLRGSAADRAIAGARRPAAGRALDRQGQRHHLGARQRAPLPRARTGPRLERRGVRGMADRPAGRGAAGNAARAPPTLPGRTDGDPRHGCWPREGPRR